MLRRGGYHAEEKVQEPPKTTAVLYLWGNSEKNSAAALDLARETSAIDYLSIVDVRNLRFGEIPEWLVGVPTLLTTNGSEDDAAVFKGTSCLQKIQDIAQYPGEFESTVVEEEEAMPPRGAPETMPMQNIQGIGPMATRQMTMPRGLDEQASAGRPDVSAGGSASAAAADPRAQMQFDPSQTEEKISASDMQVEIEEILKRREALMNEAQQNGGGGPLPSAPASS